MTLQFEFTAYQADENDGDLSICVMIEYIDTVPPGLTVDLFAESFDPKTGQCCSNNNFGWYFYTALLRA